MVISAKIKESMQKQLKKYQRLIKNIKDKEVNEANTVDVVSDFLSDVLGYERYKDITREYAIRGTFCDIAILDEKEKPRIMLEVKQVGLNLQDSHVKQAIDYCANNGTEWAILTNSNNWKIFKVKFGKPITKELVAEFNILDMKASNIKDLELLYSISKYGIKKSAIDEYYLQNQCKDKKLITEILFTDSIISGIKRSLKKIYPKGKISNEEVLDILKKDIIRVSLTEEDDKEVKKLIRKLNVKK